MHILIFSLGFSLDYPIDNLAVDADGQLWAAGMQETCQTWSTFYFIHDGWQVYPRL